jgi:hypothetical protein
MTGDDGFEHFGAHSHPWRGSQTGDCKVPWSRQRIQQRDKRGDKSDKTIEAEIRRCLIAFSRGGAPVGSLYLIGNSAVGALRRTLSEQPASAERWSASRQNARNST